VERFEEFAEYARAWVLRVHRHRRARPAVMAAGFVLVAAIPLVFAPPGSGSGGAGATASPTGAAEFTAALWSPTIAPPAQAKVVDPVDTDWQAGALLLRSMLPESGRERYSGESPSTTVYGVTARVAYADASGRVVTVSYPTPAAPLSCGGAPAQATGQSADVRSCTLTRFANATVRVRRDVAWRKGAITRVAYEVEIKRSGGFTVSVAETVAETGAALNPAKLYGIAGDPRWAWTMERAFVAEADREIHA
jgi:hypothetical protein